MIIILNIINQGKVLDPAGKRDEATHHAVEELGDKYRPNRRGGGGDLFVVIERKAFDAHNL
jgi:hypothetical protein